MASKKNKKSWFMSLVMRTTQIVITTVPSGCVRTETKGLWEEDEIYFLFCTILPFISFYDLLDSSWPSSIALPSNSPGIIILGRSLSLLSPPPLFQINNLLKSPDSLLTIYLFFQITSLDFELQEGRRYVCFVHCYITIIWHNAWHVTDTALVNDWTEHQSQEFDPTLL